MATAGPFSPDELKSFCIKALTQVKVSQADAELVAESLVDADSCGGDTHGIGRLPLYVQGIEKGVFNPTPNIKTLNESPSVALLDGNHGLGQVIAIEAIKRAIDKAKVTGIGLVGARNSTHLGRLAFIAQSALKFNVVGGVMGNTQPMMAPWGGKTAKIGNNPFCIAIPGGSQGPVILDMSCSVVAKGRIRQSASQKETIPKTWALDEEGNPTDDPGRALKGVLLPFGGYKGYGIALLIEILAGIMTGAGFSTSLGTLYPLTDKHLRYGVLTFAFNPEIFIPKKVFGETLDHFLQDLKSPPFAEGYSRIYAPGEPEMEIKKRTAKDGIRLIEEDYIEIKKLGQHLGILPPQSLKSKPEA